MTQFMQIRAMKSKVHQHTTRSFIAKKVHKMWGQGDPYCAGLYLAVFKTSPELKFNTFKSSSSWEMDLNAKH